MLLTYDHGAYAQFGVRWGVELEEGVSPSGPEKVALAPPATVWPQARAARGFVAIIVPNFAIYSLKLFFLNKLKIGKL